MRGGYFSTLVALLIVAGHPPGPPLPEPGDAAPRSDSPSPILAFDSIRTDLRDYAWPLPASRIVTSTFGEYRRTHYHAGIDISTGDATGFPVVAARDGEVTRIRIEASGYGKILYLRHADGYTTTYAHLRAFAGPMERRAAAEQQRLERYPVDILPPPGEFRVRKGEVIAYSGETGTGSEHLHFEIRDENMNGVNPFLAPGLRNADRVPPRFLKLAVLPIGIGSRVDGSPDPRTFTPRQTGARSFHLRTPIRVGGTVGFAVAARDRTPGSRFTNGIYIHTLSVDGRKHFEIRLDRIPIADAHLISLTTARDFPGAGRWKFEKLYVDGLYPLPFYADPGEGAGEIDASRLPAGTHTFAILSQDFNGNTAELTGTFIIGPSVPLPPSPATPEMRLRPHGITDVSELTRHGILAAIQTEGIFTQLPSVAIEEGSRRRRFTMELVTGRRAEALIVPLDSIQGYRSLLFEGETNGVPFRLGGGISCYPIIPGRPVRIAPGGTDLLLEGDRDAVFDTTYLQIRRIPSDEGVRFDLGPTGGLLRRGLRVTLPLLAGDPRQGIFFRTRGSWTLADRRPATGERTITAHLPRWIGDIWVTHDSTPPALTSLRILRYAPGAPLARFRLRDDLAGVDYQSLATYIDGKFVCPDIDGEHRRASVRAPAGLTRGSHRLTIRLSDHLGNTSILERRFNIP